MFTDYLADRSSQESLASTLFTNSLCLIAQNSLKLQGYTEDTLHIYLEEFEGVFAYENSVVGKIAHINVVAFSDLRSIYKHRCINSYFNRVCKTFYRGLDVTFPFVFVASTVTPTNIIDFIVDMQLNCGVLHEGYAFEEDSNYWLFRLMTNMLLLKFGYPDIWFDSLLNTEFKTAVLNKNRVVCRNYLEDDIKKALDFWA